MGPWKNPKSPPLANRVGMNAVVPAQKIVAEIQYGAALSGPDLVMALLYEIRVIA